MLPNFQLKIFYKWMKVKASAKQYQHELIFYPYNYYGSFGQVGYPVMRFESVSSATTENGLVQIIEFYETIYKKNTKAA